MEGRASTEMEKGSLWVVLVKGQKCPSPKNRVMHKPSTADKSSVWRDPMLGVWNLGAGDQTPRSRALPLQASLYEPRGS